MFTGILVCFLQRIQIFVVFAFFLTEVINNLYFIWNLVTLDFRAVWFISEYLLVIHFFSDCLFILFFWYIIKPENLPQLVMFLFVLNELTWVICILLIKQKVSSNEQLSRTVLVIRFSHYVFPDLMNVVSTCMNSRSILWHRNDL